MLFGSLCSLFIGSTDVKNTVCLLLRFWNKFPCASLLVSNGIESFNKSAGETSVSDFSIVTNCPVLVNGLSDWFWLNSSHKSAMLRVDADLIDRKQWPLCRNHGRHVWITFDLLYSSKFLVPSHKLHEILGDTLLEFVQREFCDIVPWSSRLHIECIVPFRF